MHDKITILENRILQLEDKIKQLENSLNNKCENSTAEVISKTINNVSGNVEILSSTLTAVSERVKNQENTLTLKLDATDFVEYLKGELSDMKAVEDDKT